MVSMDLQPMPAGDAGGGGGGGTGGAASPNNPWTRPAGGQGHGGQQARTYQQIETLRHGWSRVGDLVGMDRLIRGDRLPSLDVLWVTEDLMITGLDLYRSSSPSSAASLRR
jgi:hypothetical protein